MISVRTLLLGGVSVALLALQPAALLAQTHEESPMWGEPLFDNPDDIEDPEEWKEGKVTLPPYPKDSDLVELNLPSHGDSYTTYIDGATLMVGKDSVVRYVVVIRSSRGVDNVLVEGIRCGTREYREYAYGASGDSFEPVGDRPWRQIGQPSGAFSYRLALSEEYACRYDRNPYPKETILKLIAGQTEPGREFLTDPY